MTDQDLVIINGSIYTPSGVIEKGHLVVRHGKIHSMGKGSAPLTGSSRVIDAANHLVLPGFIDIHVNGGGGSLAIDGSVEAIRTMAQAHSKYGTTAMLPTTISADDETLRSAISAIAEAAESGTGGAQVLGANLEGPFLSPSKSGAHRKEFLKPPSVDYFDELQQSAKGRLRIMGLAPELEGAMDIIRLARERGVIVALAHSDADYQNTREAINAGLRLCSHIFNAMPPLMHRSPGPVGAFLTSNDTFVEVISDGFHVHPAVIEVVLRAKGIDRVILVTDAVTPAGTTVTEFSIFGTKLYVKGNSCFTPDGGLAGSALTMNKAIKVVVDNTPTTLNDALIMASLNPARLLGIGNVKGSLEIGKDGDLVVADQNLDVHATVVGGSIVYSDRQLSV